MIPFVSIVIPMRNERDWIERCLGSVLAQEYPADRMEVIVADGMSDDGSRELLDRMAAEEPRLRVIDNPHGIVPGGLNLAIEASRGEIIARVDAHTVLEPDYLEVGVEILERMSAQNVGGPMVCRGGGQVGHAIAKAMRSRFGIGAYFHFAREEAECDTVYMGMWPREVFAEAGLFDEELVRNQDDELSYRIRKAGGRIIVSPKMRSLYQNRESFSALARQFYQYGLWKVRVLQKHPRQMSVRHFIPPAFQLAMIVLVLLGPSRPLLGLLAAGLLAYLAISFAIAFRQSEPLGVRMRMWLAFVVIHHAWAFGFLVGAVRFAPLWLRRESDPRRLSNTVSQAA